MFSKKIKVLMVYIIFITVSTTIFVQSINIMGGIKSTEFFLNAKYVQDRLDSSIRSDYDTNTLLITRILHNKPLIYFETFFISIYRSTDLSFLFSLSGVSSMYEDSFKMKMMYPVELILFIFSMIFFAKNINLLKKHFYLPLLFLFSILVIGLFLPAVNYVKIIPLIITIRTIYFVAIYEFLKRKK